MTKLPEKDLLDGSKTPKTSTREMKNALGELRDYLSGLLGTDSADKAAAREALGIDLSISGTDIIKALVIHLIRKRIRITSERFPKSSPFLKPFRQAAETVQIASDKAS